MSGVRCHRARRVTHECIELTGTRLFINADCRREAGARIRCLYKAPPRITRWGRLRRRHGTVVIRQLHITANHRRQRSQKRIVLVSVTRTVLVNRQAINMDRLIRVVISPVVGAILINSRFRHHRTHRAIR